MHELINKLDTILNKSHIDNIVESDLKIINEITNNIYKNNFFEDKYKKSYIDSLVKNHIYYMKEIFIIKNPNLIYDHILWEISTYNKMQLSNDFFKILFQVILETLIENKDSKLFNLIPVYQLLISNFSQIEIDAKNYTLKDNTNYKDETYKEFVSALLEPNLTNAIDISNRYIKNKNELKIFWEQIILNSLYTIGEMWSRGEISVGQEHTATSICQRVMSLHYDKVLNVKINMKKVLIVVSPNELHEIGARMIADLLEFNGYDTYFLGSKKTTEEIVKTINEENIKNILISTTMASNISMTKQLIKDIRDLTKDKIIEIYVGGQAFSNLDNVTKITGADLYINSFDELIDILEK
ncbi:cobalamin-dependent protein [Halarcobacter sp.]|uniref:cobalamin B12-binding domain-containing protein n=1 Tax=Halarcobacter sp. TaxID=2321133 RepID=UPI002AA5F540|nr:cobalamin-dependent protein [Halarcobacter sp.]